MTKPPACPACFNRCHQVLQNHVLNWDYISVILRRNVQFGPPRQYNQFEWRTGSGKLQELGTLYDTSVNVTNYVKFLFLTQHIQLIPSRHIGVDGRPPESVINNKQQGKRVLKRRQESILQPPPLIRRADIERMTERLDSVLIDSQSSSSSIGNSNQNSARSSCYSACSLMEARSRKRSNFSWLALRKLSYFSISFPIRDSYKSNQTSMATIPLNRSSGSGICDSEVKRLRNR